ncbi:urea ABC transporter substrate-binding protein [Halalkalibacterium halodurans]|uniref:ABC transporter (Substrate-binding protein) n=1 Tax=Halalkalibacterium halodurans (strain ATCC BAA-125 / DSM 18197 / FERM 7344 / JCM 9153 / C-125) TaxID=272558 RepID=Q9KG62_HALH5|nr:urea ABC transporter substrate-binding protein [Halalkalibacterium halodurans]MED4174310.1 urea ABC transporter substrate-binding protein [Halalkalibacterium halodurans]BAB03970.1 ABC transporter (substrate-binding protein) [Halalkalibacterium halodurans C-125]
MESSLRKTVFMMAFSLLILAACGEQTAQQQEQSAEQTEVEVGSDQIAVGILHSLSGTMAMSETSVRDAELLAIEEINEAGGVLGKELVPIIEDGASEPNIFAERATKLLQQDEVAVIFGGWTSASRKAMLPVVEENNGLLFYPVQYEGMEASPNIFYAGAAPNQQIVPAVEWLLENRGTEFFLLGSDYVFPRLANAIIKAQLESHGATLVDEQYTPLGHTDYNTIISRIRESEPTVIFNTLNGDSNVAFFKQLADAGITADDVTVMSVSVAEEEIRGIGADVLAGHLASWNYFQTTDTPENDTFVTAYIKSFGDDRVTGDPIEAGYLMVHLWAQAVEAAGTTDIEAVREAASTIEFSAPGGLVKVDGDNQHLYKTVRIGEVQADGQFEEVWNSGEPVKPDPFLEDYEWAEGISSAAAGN